MGRRYDLEIPFSPFSYLSSPHSSDQLWQKWSAGKVSKSKATMYISLHLSPYLPLCSCPLTKTGASRPEAHISGSSSPIRPKQGILSIIPSLGFLAPTAESRPLWALSSSWLLPLKHQRSWFKCGPWEPEIRISTNIQWNTQETCWPESAWKKSPLYLFW